MTRDLIAIAIFFTSFGLIIAGEKSPRKLDRPSAALLGAVMMVLGGVMTRRQALNAIDWGTIALLFGMMVVIHYATASGMLDMIARAMVARSRSGMHLLWMVCLSAGFFSALFVNDTVCLLMTPLLISVAARRRLPAKPYLLALATSSNVGSLMTLTGNPQDVLIGQSSHWTWGAYALRMAPVGIACLLINGAVLTALFRNDLRLPIPAPETANLDQHRDLDRKLAVKTLTVLVGLLAAFLAGMPMDEAALVAAVTLLVLANRAPEETFASIDWSLLLFFAGLFVVVAGMRQVEGIWLSQHISRLVSGAGSISGLSRFAAASVVGSNVFSNVPFVMLLRDDVGHAANAQLLWLVLAATSTLAGNLTLVGSVANMIVAQRAMPDCPVSFWSFLRVGVPTTVLTVVVSVLILWTYAVVGWVPN